jgi:hypothetical protein
LGDLDEFETLLAEPDRLCELGSRARTPVTVCLDELDPTWSPLKAEALVCAAAFA